jgi:hypothetical protein
MDNATVRNRASRDLLCSVFFVIFLTVISPLIPLTHCHVSPASSSLLLDYGVRTTKAATMGSEGIQNIAFLRKLVSSPLYE